MFTTLGFQVASLHSPFAVLMLWVLGGLGAFCGALCYGELGSMMPRSGGEYTYLSNIYHPAIGFLSGWVSMVAGFAAPIALAAIALGEYAGAILPGLDKTVIAVSIIVILSQVHLTDVRFGCHFQNLFTGGKILLIVSFIVLGFFVANPQDITLAPSPSDLESLFSPAIFLTLTATFNAVLTYVGFTLALFASLTVLGVFIWRRRHPHRKRPFKTWGYPVTPAIFLLL